MAPFTLYSTLLSANGRKVQAVSHQLGLRPLIRSVNVYQGEGQTPEFLAINPTGEIPVLVDDKVTLTQSNAIVLYIAEAYGGHRLTSEQPDVRATISSWLFWESAHWQPAMFPILAPLVGHRLSPELVAAPNDPANWMEPGFQQLVSHLNGHLEERSFLVADQLTLADFSVAAMMTYFRAAEFPFDRYANLSAWYERIEQLEAWRATTTELWG